MKRILIVEDEPDIQELLCAYLQDAGYETETAGDGVEALDRFRAQAFDLVLLCSCPRSTASACARSSAGARRSRW